MREVSAAVMPASLFETMDRSPTGLEDQRALQLALELSMLGLNGSNSQDTSSNSDHSDGGVSAFSDELRNKKSQNMTECVPVPSSEHVAEIVGRQGCKIKALRAKTNTYIKTPVRGEEPVFVVTGRREDVCLAKREILSAADHFSQIRASRKSNMNGSLAPGPPANIPGQVTIQVRVPYRVVGLVVGPKGATIKRIQQQTHTYIVTPSRERDPVFEVTGLPEDVEMAKKEIESHISLRTGGLFDNATEDDFHRNGIEQTLTTADIFHSLYKNGFSAGIGDNSGYSTLDGLESLQSRPTPDQLFGLNLDNHLADIWSDMKPDLSRRSSSLGSSRVSPTLIERPQPRRLNSDPLSNIFSASPTEERKQKDCILCYDSQVVAALVPCGHNLF